MKNYDYKDETKDVKGKVSEEVLGLVETPEQPLFAKNSAGFNSILNIDRKT